MFKRKQPKFKIWDMIEQTLQPDKELALIALKLGKDRGLWFPFIKNWGGSYLGYNSNYRFCDMGEYLWDELILTGGTTQLITSAEPFIVTRLHGQMIKFYCVVGGWISGKWYDYPLPFEAPYKKEK